MKTIVILFGSSLLGGLGWWLGSFVGLPTAALLSGLASGFGLWFTRKLAETYLE